MHVTAAGLRFGPERKLLCLNASLRMSDIQTWVWNFYGLKIQMSLHNDKKEEDLLYFCFVIWHSQQTKHCWNFIFPTISWLKNDHAWFYQHGLRTVKPRVWFPLEIREQQINYAQKQLLPLPTSTKLQRVFSESNLNYLKRRGKKKKESI